MRDDGPSVARNIINEELKAQFGYRTGTYGVNNYLTSQGINLQNGGGVDFNYDYNVFDPNASVGNDNSYMGIMANSGTTAHSYGYGGSFTRFNTDDSFTLRNSGYIPPKIDFSGVNNNADGTKKGTESAKRDETASNDGSTVQKASYKFVKNGPNGTWTVEYTLDGKNVTATEFHRVVKDKNFAAVQEELKKKNQAAS